ncbi:SRPBCC family protein [Rhodococcus gannanensis]|uniref:SRPBCC family protein n=1 Tax=Rhodococcus gannanensis TaxID=1960308 RepID=A0ABW4P4H0_9NOCA
MSTAVVVEQSRAIPVTLQRAFDLTLPIPLTSIFSRRYGLLPPIKRVEQDGIWSHVGQSRTVVTTDGGTMRELLTVVDSPRSFGYRLSNITGPLRPLVDTIDGSWEFAPKGTGTLVTWRWVLHPKGVGVLVMPLLTSMWRGYARQALEMLSEQLLTPESTDRGPGA